MHNLYMLAISWISSDNPQPLFTILSRKALSLVIFEIASRRSIALFGYFFENTLLPSSSCMECITELYKLSSFTGILTEANAFLFIVYFKVLSITGDSNRSDSEEEVDRFGGRGHALGDSKRYAPVACFFVGALGVVGTFCPVLGTWFSGDGGGLSGEGMLGEGFGEGEGMLGEGMFGEGFGEGEGLSGDGVVRIT